MTRRSLSSAVKGVAPVAAHEARRPLNELPTGEPLVMLGSDVELSDSPLSTDSRLTVDETNVKIEEGMSARLFEPPVEKQVAYTPREAPRVVREPDRRPAEPRMGPAMFIVQEDRKVSLFGQVTTVRKGDAFEPYDPAVNRLIEQGCVLVQAGT